MSGKRFLAVTASGALLASLLVPTTLSAQTGTIVGRVTDAQSRTSLSGVELMVADQRQSGLSRPDGRFILVGVPTGEQLVRAQRIGYGAVERTAVVTADGTVVLDFALSPQPLDLDGVVVTGAAGSARLREVGSSVSQLDLGEVTARPATVSDFLQGGAVGMAVTGGSSEAGQGKQIRLRGNTSMVLSNQPLIYVDGVRMMEGAFPSGLFTNSPTTPQGANVTTSPLDLVDVGDIDRIEVIKGPAATTLFGTGSAAGVIQIFTKRGARGAPSWTAEVTQGTGWVQPFGINGVNYLHVENFLRDPWWGGGYEGGPASGECVTDDPRWKGVNKTADGGCSWPGAQWYQTYRLAVDGGVPSFSYFVSGEYQNDAYSMPLDRLRRSGVRANLHSTVVLRLDVETHAAYSRFWTANTVSGDRYDGLLLSSMRQYRNYLGSADPTVIAELLKNRNDQWIDRFTGGLGVTFSQSARVSHRLTFGYDYSKQDLRTLREPGYIFDPVGGITLRIWQRRLRTFDYLGTYEFSLRPAIRSTLSWGGQLVTDDITSRIATGDRFLSPQSTTPQATESGATYDEVGGTKNEGLFAQDVLALEDRYFLTLGVRLDRHFARGETFVRLDPKVSGAWVLSDEAFWPSALGALRLRSAYGRSGSAASPFQQAFSYRGQGPLNAPAGNVLEPERSTEWEIGLDGAVLDGRLTTAFTYYDETTSHALVNVEEDSPTLPIRSNLENVGKIRNRGIELQVDGAVVRDPDWGLNLGLGVSTEHSKVLNLGGAEPFRDLGAQMIVGYPVPVSYGHKVAHPDAVNGPWSSDRYVQDANGDVASLSLGPEFPTLYVQPTLSLRVPGGVTFDARGEYRGGNVRFVNPVPVSRGAVSPLCFPYYADPNVAVDPAASLALKPDTPDLWQERCTPSAADDYWYDADYLKLRSVSATIPVRWAFPGGVDDAMLTVTLANAWSWYRDVPWWDLEVLGDAGANDDSLGSSDRVPAPATLTFGLRVRF